MLLYNTLVLAGNGTTDLLLVVVHAKFLLALNERNFKAHVNLVILFKSLRKKANITCGSLYPTSCFKEVLMLKTFFPLNNCSFDFSANLVTALSATGRQF
jgi:hypothetical protein